MSILSKLLQKRGVDESGLSPEEKTQYDNWKRILTEEGITVEKIADFCRQMISVIESKWASLEISADKKAELVPYHTVYRAIQQVIDGPKSERERLEKYLNQLLES